MTQNAPPMARLLPPGPSSPSARRAGMLFKSLLGTFLHPPDSPYDLPLSYWEIGLHVIASPALTDRVSRIPEL
jgi:hypothetical protein